MLKETNLDKINNRRKAIMKMVDISSLPKQIKKIISKAFKEKNNLLNEDEYSKISEYLRNMYDHDFVSDLLQNMRDNFRNDFCFDKNCLILQNLLASEIEKEFIDKIKKKVIENEELDEQIKKVEKIEKEELTKKLKKDKLKEKSTKSDLNLQIYENKLEKANQKLNLAITENDELRTKINLMRKEKNIVQRIFK